MAEALHAVAKEIAGNHKSEKKTGNLKTEPEKQNNRIFTLLVSMLNQFLNRDQIAHHFPEFRLICS